MANTFQFVTGYMGLECLRQLVNRLEIGRLFNTEQNKDYQRPFAIGETTMVKLPQRFTIRDGLKYTEQGLNRKTVPVTMDQVFGIHFAWDSVEEALKLERSETEIRDQYLAPAMKQLAQEIDSRCALFAYQNTNNIAGVLGTTPTTMQTYSRARTLLHENACPEGSDRVMVISPQMLESAVAANLAAFNPVSEISRQFRTGEVGEYAGSTWVESMSLYDHTAGTYDSTGTCGAVADGATSITLTGTNGQTLKKGDILGFDTAASTVINKVNPSTRRSTGRAATVVVTQDVTLTGGADTVPVAVGGTWPIYGPGNQYQNVAALPSNGQTVVLFPGTTTPAGKHGINGLNFTRDAFAMVSAPLDMPKAVEPVSFMKRDPKTGISIRFVRAWDQTLSRMTNRFDVMLGFGALYADSCSVRVLSLQ